VIELEHEVDGKSVDVSLDGLEKRAWFDVVEVGQMRAEHDLLAAQKEDALFDSIREDLRDQYCCVGRLPLCPTWVVGEALPASAVVFGLEGAAPVGFPFEDGEADASLVVGARLLPIAFSPASRFWARGVAPGWASD
jgi:hypothetical protein